MIRKTGCAVATLLVCGMALPVWADDEDDVAAAMNMWGDYLAKGTSEDPGAVLTLYAEDAVLWGTISRTRRDDPAAIRDYFVNVSPALIEILTFDRGPGVGSLMLLGVMGALGLLGAAVSLLSARVVTTALRGHGTSSSASRRRITALSWACTSASGPGRTATPSASSACRWSVGTCSWSKVTTPAPSVTRRSVGRSV